MSKVSASQEERLEKRMEVQRRCGIDEEERARLEYPQVSGPVHRYIFWDFLDYANPERSIEPVISAVKAARRLQKELPSIRLTPEIIQAVENASPTQTLAHALSALMQRQKRHIWAVTVVMQHLWPQIVRYIDDVDERCDLALAFPDLIPIREVEQTCHWDGFRHALLRELTALITLEDIHCEPSLSAEMAMYFECIQDYMDDILDSAASGASLFKDLRPEICAEAVYRHVAEKSKMSSEEAKRLFNHLPDLDPGSAEVEFQMYHVTHHRWRCWIWQKRKWCHSVWDKTTMQYAAKSGA